MSAHCPDCGAVAGYGHELGHKSDCPSLSRLRASTRRSDVKMGRLAMRHEGPSWNAYYALPGTMEGAIFLGSIAMRFIDGKDERREAFMGLMRDAVSDLIEELTGQRPTWPEGPQTAPEHERAGHG